MFRLVMNPKMKNSAVTVINGTRYPGDVSADDCFVCVAILRLIPASSKELGPVRPRFHIRFRIPAPHCSQDGRPNSPPVGLPSLRSPGFWLHTTLYAKPHTGEVARSLAQSAICRMAHRRAIVGRLDSAILIERRGEARGHYSIKRRQAEENPGCSRRKLARRDG